MFPGGPPQFILVPPGSVPVMMQPAPFPVFVQQPTQGTIPTQRPVLSQTGTIQ